MSIKFKYLDKLYKRAHKIGSIYIGDIITEEKLNLYLEGEKPDLRDDQKLRLSDIHAKLIHEPYYLLEGVKMEFERNLLNFTDLRRAENYSEYFTKQLSGTNGMLIGDIPWELKGKWESLNSNDPIDAIFIGINEFSRELEKSHLDCLILYAVFKHKTFKNEDDHIEYAIDETSTQIPFMEKVDYLKLANLSDFFVSKEAYDHVMELLVKEGYCLPGSLTWIVPNKTELARYLWHLKNLGFFRKDIAFSDQTVRYVAEVYFGKKMEKRTSEKGKNEHLENHFNTYRIHPKINPLEPASS